MVIYADILVLTNLYVDFFLLLSVKKFLNLNISAPRILLGTVCGAFTSLFSLLFPGNSALQFFFALLSAALISFSAVFPSSLRVFLKLFCGLFVSAFLLAGLSLILLRFIPLNNISVLNGRLYFDISPPSLFLITLFAYIVLSLFRKFFGTTENPVRLTKITVESNGASSELFAKADTGNSLVEPFSGLPVIVAESSSLKKLLPQDINRLSPEKAAESGLRLVSFSSLGGRGVLPAFKPKKLYFSKSRNEINAYIAVYSGKLSEGQYNAVFNPDKLFESSGARPPNADIPGTAANKI